MELLKDVVTARPAIVARTKRGTLIHGHLAKGRQLSRGVLQMVDSSGEPLSLDVTKLKAVFFVRDFAGNQDYLEQKTLTGEPTRTGLTVRLRFDDNEILEGTTENALELLLGPGFYFWPADPESNNRLIYVVKGSLIGFRALDVHHH